MGAKISKAMRQPHMEQATASAPTVTSHHGEMQTGYCQDMRLPDVKNEMPLPKDAAVAASSADNHTDSPPTNDTSMESEQTRRDSTDSRTEELLKNLQELPGEGFVPQPPSNCIICDVSFTLENKDEAIKPCTCESSFCVNCLRKMFIDACRDMSRMPPKCCSQIRLHQVRRFLTEDEVAEFKISFDEWLTPNPFYCPVARCSAFIPTRLLPQARTNRKGKQRVDSAIGTPTLPIVDCPKCEAEICTSCRALAHPNTPCNSLEFGIDKETTDLLKSWGYKRCPKCGHGVRRMHGCPHMECHCGAHFCWVCLESRETCEGDCDDDSEVEYNTEEENENDESDHSEEEALPPDEDSQIPVNTEGAANGEATTDRRGTADGNTTETAPPITGDHQATPEAQSEAPSNTQQTPQRQPRLRNLDRGSDNYWAQQELDFGDEPTDDYQDRYWHCHHVFKTAHSCNGVGSNDMECMKCWVVIHPNVRGADGTATGDSTRTDASAASGSSDTPMDRTPSEFDTDSTPLNPAFECTSCQILLCGDCRELMEPVRKRRKKMDVDEDADEDADEEVDEDADEEADEDADEEADEEVAAENSTEQTSTEQALTSPTPPSQDAATDSTSAVHSPS